MPEEDKSAIKNEAVKIWEEESTDHIKVSEEIMKEFEGFDPIITKNGNIKKHLREIEDRIRLSLTLYYNELEAIDGCWFGPLEMIIKNIVNQTLAKYPLELEEVRPKPHVIFEEDEEE